ncbi:DNA primase [Puniceicoccales bacterium CK1056]|uniref:DNA primase n=1 Tax=Oceanipulchritudo coccoides TaxID=2706888 RepID=A0A6B2LZK4_9BACT|nr:DNA primase [Oceanipulchritudo coccoides]NDV62098.1 DNA primase [Oceanipulchritudo coccoides]
MPFFSEETLQAVRAIPLYDVVRPHVELTRSGRNWRGLSPFSQEKTPSFYVLSERNFFKCHSTGLAGDGIRFIQETEKLTFPEAVEALAERFGIEVRYASGAGPDPEVRSMKQALLDVHEYARDYYHEAFLAMNPQAEEIRRYWVEQRGFSLKLADEFRIGFSPPESRELLDRLKGKGFKQDVLAASGLFYTGRQPADLDRWFFVFRGRLMVPIRDIQGQVIAFTARQLDVTPRDHASWKAKYINSPETPIFKKSQLLFNLDRAREGVKQAGRLLLVEGQLDALRCWDCGVTEAVAPQGTSVTEEQLALVKRYTDQLTVLLDSDEAGVRAVLRLLPMAFKNRLQVTVLALPKGEDPDDFLRSRGAEGLKQLDPQTGMHFAGHSLLQGDKPTPEGRANALNTLFKMLMECPSAVVREGYFEEAVQVTGVSREAAVADFKRLARESKPPNPARVERKENNNGTKAPEALTILEGDLLWAVLQNVTLAETLAQVIDHQWIKLQIIEGKLLSLILAQALEDHIEKAEDIHLLLETDEERDCFARYLVDERPHIDMESFVNLTIASLARRYCREQVRVLNQKISECANNPDDLTQIRDLMNQKNELFLQMTKGEFPSISLNG